MVGWKCTRCGSRHLTNPSECKHCGTTVLQQSRRGSGSRLLPFLLGAAGGGVAGLWYNGVLVF